MSVRYSAAVVWVVWSAFILSWGFYGAPEIAGVGGLLIATTVTVLVIEEVVAGWIEDP